MAIEFHRLTVPGYTGGLPATHDYINNEAAGTPSLADGVKSGGLNDGTYFVAFGEDGITNFANRPHQALAENTDFLDDVVHRDLAVATVKQVVLTGTTDQLPITGDIYVGPPGSVNNQITRDGLALLIESDGKPLVVEGPTGFFTAITVAGIEDGGTVIGAGFHTDPIIVTNVALAAGTYFVACYERTNVKTQPSGLVTKLLSGEKNINTLQALVENNASFYPAHSTGWHDSTAVGVQPIESVIRQIVDDLVADEGSDRIGSDAISGTQVSHGAGSIYDQLTELFDFINEMLDTRANIWGGINRFEGGTASISPMVIVGNANQPSSPNEGDLNFYTGGTPDKLQTYIGGDWRTFAEEQGTRTFMYPLACGHAENWFIANGTYEWEKSGASNELFFSLNRFVPQGSTITSISVGLDPGTVRVGVNRMKVTYGFKNHATLTHAPLTPIEEDYDDGTSNAQWVTLSPSPTPFASQGIEFAIVVKGGNDATTDAVLAIAIQYQEDEYMRLP